VVRIWKTRKAQRFAVRKILGKHPFGDEEQNEAILRQSQIESMQGVCIIGIWYKFVKVFNSGSTVSALY
jgi:hypothetical protein